MDQIRTIDKQRVVKLLGELSHPEIKEIKSVISEIYVE
ncbi:MAG: type II toxin-antitoxin system PemK/MazF family toxin [Bacteroidales bacterium]|nr:type II toxin-antitoxin system PemK/MazF family toxin [Bacteroidales bacterium]MCF8337322.1 type II toxin-antitoxin system PemK/MazF family toxin [Bacteroidales bacterium]